MGTAAFKVGDMDAPAAAGLTDESNREIKSCAKEDSSNATLPHQQQSFYLARLWGMLLYDFY
jgi:hypothetical protein